MAQLEVLFRSDYLLVMRTLFFHHNISIWLDSSYVMVHCISYEASLRAKHVCVLTTADSRPKIWLVKCIQVPHPLQPHPTHPTPPNMYVTGPRSAVGNVSGYRCVSDCRSRGCKFDPGPVPYFRGDWSWNNVILLPSSDLFKKGCCQLQAKVCAQITG